MEKLCLTPTRKERSCATLVSTAESVTVGTVEGNTGDSHMSSSALAVELQLHRVLLVRLFRKFLASTGSSGKALNSESQSRWRHILLLALVKWQM